MALWYIGSPGKPLGKDILKTGILRQARLAISTGTPVLASDRLHLSCCAGMDANSLHRASLEIKARNQMAFEGFVTHEGHTRFTIRIDIMKRLGAPAPTATIKHKGRAVDPSHPSVQASLEHYADAIGHLYSWLNELIESDRVDYRAQSPKLRLDEEKRWGHPFPLGDTDLRDFRSAMMKEMAKLPDLLDKAWQEKTQADTKKGKNDSHRLQVMNALPDGAPLATVDGDRLYGTERISIGRKFGTLGAVAARRSRLLRDHDLQLITASDDFPLSNHAYLNLCREVAQLRERHPEACHFDLPYRDLKIRPHVILSRAPCLPSFLGKSHPSPSSVAGIRDYCWIRTAPDSGQCKEFAPAQVSAPWPEDYRECARQNLQGFGLPAGMPLALSHLPGPRSGPLRLQDMIAVKGFWLVSERCRRILQDHSLGQTAFEPVELQDNTGAPLETGQWSYISFRESRTLFNKEASQAALGFGHRKSPPYSLSVYEHDQVSLMPPHEHELDLWVDRQVYDSFFMSGRLALALKNAKLNLRLGLRRCLHSA